MILFSMSSKQIWVGIGVLILKDNKVLLGKRHGDPQKADSLLDGAGTWTMPWGKLEFRESFKEGARREVQEETGLDLNDIEVFCVNNDIVKDAHFVTISLISRDFEGRPEVKEPDQIVEWKWFELDDLPSPLYFPSKKTLQNYKEDEFYIE